MTARELRYILTRAGLLLLEIAVILVLAHACGWKGW